MADSSPVPEFYLSNLGGKKVSIQRIPVWERQRNSEQNLLEMSGQISVRSQYI